MSFTAATPKRKSNTDTWITPQWIIDSLGGKDSFDLDPCGFRSETGFIVETAKTIWTLQDGIDGLNNEWFGNVFLNFPYSEGKIWMDKMKSHGSGVVLCFARTETRAWQDNVPYSSGILLINKRISFLNSNGVPQTNGNAPSALIAYGDSNFELLSRFQEKNSGILLKTV